jgi:hypothetical protein
MLFWRSITGPARPYWALYWRPSGLDHVSSCDYWTLNHTAGSSAVNVTGYWNANSPCGGTYVNDLATIAVAHFNGTSWNAWGNRRDIGVDCIGIRHLE